MRTLRDRGRRVVQGPAGGLDREMVERVLTEQVLAGAPLVDWPAERTIGGVRRVYGWSALRIAANGRVVGPVGWLVEITERERAAADLERARARLDLLARASSQIGIPGDVHPCRAQVQVLHVRLAAGGEQQRIIGQLAGPAGAPGAVADRISPAPFMACLTACRRPCGCGYAFR